MIDYDQIMQEMDEAQGGASALTRTVTLSGKTGEYREWVKDKAFNEDDPLALRKKLEMIVLYVPQDQGQELWPDQKIFVGDKALCKSRRSAPGFDRAFVSADASTKSTMARMGWTGHCSNCALATSKDCKPALNAYIYDLGAEPCVSILNAKGPQSTWNFYGLMRKELAAFRKANPGAALNQVVWKLSTEPGNQGSRKAKIEVVRSATDVEASVAKALAIEAYQMANVKRSAAPPALPPASRPAALPQHQSDVEVIDPDEIPF